MILVGSTGFAKYSLATNYRSNPSTDEPANETRRLTM